jgi:DNA-binding NtrC family response regulator
MDKHWDILVVSARLENKRALLRILQGLPVSAFTASTVQQAHEVLSTHSIRVIFCEENFADGSYRDLLATGRTLQIRTPLVLMLSTGEWEEYLEAMSLGATEALRCPLEPTDVELTLIRIARQHEGQTDRPVRKAPPAPLADGGAVSSTAN